MRLISPSLSVATLFFSLLSFDLIAAYECPSSCGTPSSLAFCEHISWATCRTTQDWEHADQLAQQDYLNFLKARGYNASSADGVNATISTSHELSVGINSGEPTAALGAPERFTFTDECLRALRLLHCSAYFPVCEIGMETQPICEGECEDRMTAVCGLPAEDAETLDATCKPLYSTKGDEAFQVKGSQRSRKCTKLDYDGPAMGMWVAGFLISLIFSVLAALGINMQKYSLTKYERLGLTDVPPFKQPFWVLGFILILSGSILDFIAFGLAPQTLLAPLAALSLVWNMILAPLFHNEKVRTTSLRLSLTAVSK